MSQIRTVIVNGAPIPLTENNKLAASIDCCCGRCSSDADCSSRCCWQQCTEATACLDWLFAPISVLEGNALTVRLLAFNAPPGTKVTWQAAAVTVQPGYRAIDLAQDLEASSGEITLNEEYTSSPISPAPLVGEISIQTVANCAASCPRQFKLTASTSGTHPTENHALVLNPITIRDDTETRPELSVTGSGDTILRPGENDKYTFTLVGKWPTDCTAAIVVQATTTSSDSNFSAEDVVLTPAAVTLTPAAESATVEVSLAAGATSNATATSFQVVFEYNKDAAGTCAGDQLTSQELQIGATFTLTSVTVDQRSIQEYCQSCSDSDGSFTDNLQAGDYVFVGVNYTNPTTSTVSGTFSIFGLGFSREIQAYDYSRLEWVTSAGRLFEIDLPPELTTAYRPFRVVDGYPPDVNADESFTVSVTANDQTKTSPNITVTDNTACTETDSADLNVTLQGFYIVPPGGDVAQGPTTNATIYSGACEPSEVILRFNCLNYTGCDLPAILSFEPSTSAIAGFVVDGALATTAERTLQASRFLSVIGVVVRSRSNIVATGTVQIKLSVDGLDAEYLSGDLTVIPSSAGCFTIHGVTVSNSFYNVSPCNFTVRATGATVNVGVSAGSATTMRLSSSNANAVFLNAANEKVSFIDLSIPAGENLRYAVSIYPADNITETLKGSISARIPATGSVIATTSSAEFSVFKCAAPAGAAQLYIKYSWTTASYDLDTATKFLEEIAGYQCNNNEAYIEGWGDRTGGDGVFEELYINFAQARKDNAWTTDSTTIPLYAAWYRGEGNATISAVLTDADKSPLGISKELTVTPTPGGSLYPCETDPDNPKEAYLVAGIDLNADGSFTLG